jgi:hypothetical protein
VKKIVREHVNRDLIRTTQTAVCLIMVIDIVRRRIIWWVATDIRLTSALVYTHVVDEHLGGERHRRQIDCLPIRCSGCLEWPYQTT